MFAEDDRLLINMTVWESIDALFDFTYKSQHVEFFRRRREWFEKLEDYPALVLWWVPAGYHPTPHAFTFKRRFTVEDMLAV